MKIIYSKKQLNDTVDFISKNNIFFKGNKDKINQHILYYMKELVNSKDPTYVATMGFILIPMFQYESIDNDEDTCHIDIYVDPSLSRMGETFSEDDTESFNI